MKKYVAAIMILGFLGAGVFAVAQDKPVPAPKPQPGPGQIGPGGPGQGPLGQLKDWLGLTPDQVTKLQETRKGRQEAQKGFRDQMQKLRGELAPLLKDPKADPNKVNGLFDQIAKVGAERAKKGYQDRLALGKILTPDQMAKLGNLRGLAARGMRGRQGMRPGMGMGRGMAPMGQGMRPGMGMGRGQMMGPRGGMRGPGFGMGMGQGRGAGFAPGLRLRILRWLRGW